MRAMTVHVKQFTAAKQQELLAKLDAACDRLNAGLDVIDRSFEIRALLYMGVLGLDDAADLVEEFKRDAQTYRRGAL
jgi:hypothetical protein